MRYFFKPKATLNYPFEKGPHLAALPRRACAAPLSERRGALHRLQAVRGDLPGAGDHHRGRPAPQRRHAAHHALRHRHGEVHLLRLLPGGLPGRRHRRGAELRVRRPRRARSSTTTRRSCSRTATAGSARSPRTSRSTRRTGEDEPAPMILPALVLLSLRRRVRGVGVHGDRGAATRAFGAVPDPRLLQRRRPVRADGRRVPGDDPGRRLCRRGRGAVPVRGDDARRRLRRAAPGLPAISAGRRRWSASCCWPSCCWWSAPG